MTAHMLVHASSGATPQTELMLTMQ
jgi:hypothetical protein